MIGFLRKSEPSMRFESAVLFNLSFLLFAGVARGSVLYVDLNSTSPIPPYSTWSTAATNIQDAVDASTNGDLVLVTNGVYSFGTQVVDNATNRVAVTNAITLRSVNGRDATIIDGTKSVRCVYLCDGTVLDGFTLTNGYVPEYQPVYGGGAYCESTNVLIANSLIISNSSSYGGGVISGSLTNCVISFNYSSGAGGGAGSCALDNCSLSNNRAYNWGGGCCDSTLRNCTLSRNSVGKSGGGAYYSTLNNCLVVGNRLMGDGLGSGTYACALDSCTICSNYPPTAVDGTPMFGLGPSNHISNCIIYYNWLESIGNVGSAITNCCIDIPNPPPTVITNAPLFVDVANGDFHLQSNSPCINAGKNALVTTATDLDTNPRIAGGTVDMGAYEYQKPTSVLSYAWAQQYGLPTDGSVDFSDSDGDGVNNRQECVAGTIPTNAASLLEMYSPSNDISGVTVKWQSVTNVTYFLQRSADLSLGTDFSTIQSNIVGRSNLTTFTDVTATNGSSFFYRVGVQQ